MAHQLADYTFSSERAQASIQRILAALGEHPMSRKELAPAVHKSATSVAQYLRYLQGDEELGFPRRVRIDRWLESGGGHVPVYALGVSKDAPKPPRKTASQRYKNLKADTEKYERILARKRELMNSPRPRSTSLASRIERYLGGNPARGSRAIAEALCAPPRHVVVSLQRLRRHGKVKIVRNPNGKRPAWSLVAHVDVEIAPAPILVRSWKSPVLPPQTIFSALGL